MRYFFALFLAAALSGQAPYSLDDVQKKFSGIDRFDVVIHQTKTSKLLTQPLKSQVRMTLKSNAVTWKVLTPIETEIVMDEQGLHGGDKMRLPKSGTADKRVRAVVRMISSMIKADTAALNNDFTLTWDKLTLSAVPRKGSELDFFQSLKIFFNEKLEPYRFAYATEQESSEMEFSELSYGRSVESKP